MRIQLAAFIYVFGCCLLSSWLKPRVCKDEYTSTFLSMTMLGLVSACAVVAFYYDTRPGV